MKDIKLWQRAIFEVMRRARNGEKGRFFSRWWFFVTKEILKKARRVTKCRCNCHDPAARKAMKMKKHKDCRACKRALAAEAKWLKEAEKR